MVVAIALEMLVGAATMIGGIAFFIGSCLGKF